MLSSRVLTKAYLKGTEVYRLAKGDQLDQVRFVRVEIAYRPRNPSAT